MLWTRLKSRLRAFADDARGSITVEVVVLLPMLYWAYCAMFVYFDAYRQVSVNQKAAYTISDMLSRETDPIDRDYMNASHAMLEFLSRSRNPVRLRVSVVRYVENQDQFRRDWSKVVGGGGLRELSNRDVRNWHDKLPALLNNERIIVVETFTDYTPPFNIGMDDQEIGTFVFTKPRFAPQLLWQN
ncbi:MAG: hypothetical protein CSA70_04560 [Rhodobacterales bacterium]|nr:MAG: hypothetical protein CSA70_04560 [Rhodobacterales bacterium]